MLFRTDRLLTIHFFYPLERIVGAGTAGIPILMYHSISNDGPYARHPYYDTHTAIGRFREQMNWLADDGYLTIGLDDLASYSTRNTYGSGKAVIITFDDGFHDFYTAAFPVLSRHNYTASVFLATRYIHREHQSFNGRICLTWPEVRELHTAGVTFGSHTVNHKQLHGLSDYELEYELNVSKQVIQDEIGVTVNSFAYPYAFPETDFDFTKRLQSFLVTLGYTTALSTVIGTESNPPCGFFLKRLPINDFDDRRFFMAKLTGGYNWLRWAQRLKKYSARVGQ